MEISGPVLLVAIGVAVSYYLGVEVWHGLHWVGVHTAHVAVAVFHFLF